MTKSSRRKSSRSINREAKYGTAEIGLVATSPQEPATETICTESFARTCERLMCAQRKSEPTKEASFSGIRGVVRLEPWSVPYYSITVIPR